MGSGGGFRQSNVRFGHGRARRIGHAAIQLAAGLSRGYRRQERQHGEQANGALCSLHTSNAKPVPALVLPAAHLLMDSRHRHSLPGVKQQNKNGDCALFSSHASRAPFQFSVLIFEVNRSSTCRPELRHYT